MPRFMLLLYDTPESVQAFQNMGPADFQRIIAKYRAWGDRLRSDGLLVDSHKLTDDGGRWVTRGPKGARVSDGPFAETKEVLGGYYTIEATSYDEAIERAMSDCPHLEYGAVSVRQIEI